MTSISSNFSYCAGFVKHIAIQAAVNSLPGVSVLGAIYSIFVGLKNISPLPHYDEKVSLVPLSLPRYLNIEQYLKMASNMFIMTLQERIMKEHTSNRKSMPNNFLQIIDKTRELLKEKLNLYKTEVTGLDAKFNTSTALCFDTKPQEYNAFAPFTTFGGARLKDPSVILVQMSGIDLWNQAEESMASSQPLPASAPAPALSSSDKFVIAHEFTHILHNDPLVKSAIRIVRMALASLPWIAGFSSPLSWGGYLVYAMTRSFGIHAVSTLFEKIHSQYIEKRADLKAMECLGTNAGAIAFCNEHLAEGVEVIETYDHPSMQTRLAYAASWEARLS